jgi:EAL domain-containing protein (putative c-di-GMP-specific phosphodiesterase class I)
MNAIPDIPGSPSPVAPSPDEVRHGLAHGQFVAYYQPAVDLASGQVNSLETLARWQHPDLGLLEPACFLPAMREHDMLRELSERMLTQALYAGRGWRDAGMPMRVSVNVPLSLLAHTRLDDWVASRLQQATLESGLLILEFSEVMLSLDWDLADRQLAWLRRAAVGVAVDEFGIGLGLVTPLTRQRFSMLKIDSAIVHGASIDPKRRKWLAAALMQCKRSGLESVAVGIEEPADLDLVRTLGCQAAQGFLLAPPMPQDDVEIWIRQRKS